MSPLRSDRGTSFPRSMKRGLVAIPIFFLAHPAWGDEATKPSVTVGGYVETSVTHDFERPSDRAIPLRAFDNRHDTFVIENAVLDTTGSIGDLSARIALQVGQTPDTYYAPTDPQAWRFLQQALITYKTGVAKGLTI